MYLGGHDRRETTNRTGRRWIRRLHGQRNECVGERRPQPCVVSANGGAGTNDRAVGRLAQASGAAAGIAKCGLWTPACAVPGRQVDKSWLVYLADPVVMSVKVMLSNECAIEAVVRADQGMHVAGGEPTHVPVTLLLPMTK